MFDLNTLKQCALSLVATAALTFPFISEASAQSCNSEASCKRFVVCPVGFQMIKSGDTFACKQTSNAATANPTCARKNNMNDWQWYAGGGASDANRNSCRRMRNNGQAIHERDNITCASGFSYNASQGKCVRPGGTTFARAQLATSASANVGPSPTGMCSSQSACNKTVSCPSTYAKQTYPSNGYGCKKNEQASTANPTCARKNNMNDWQWYAGGGASDANRNSCRRMRNNGQAIHERDNITCASGFSYNASQGKCVRPGGLFWSTPNL